MNDWTKQRLDEMIADNVEENLTLDYKRGDSLAKTDGRKTEITKDVSAFANSSGGILIYGIAESTDETKRHLPERLDPIRRTEFSKEWLDQVVQTIQPRIEGVAIYPVTISEQDDTVCYVVEVPQSHTAHMARDHRYHKRHNFTALAMEDYEVRDVMNRRTHPKIRGSVFVNLNPSSNPTEGLVLVRLENVGLVLARYVMVELELPLEMQGSLAVEQPVWIKETEGGQCHLFRLLSDLTSGPLFPGSDLTLRRKLFRHIKTVRRDGKSLSSTPSIKVSIFADEMQPIRSTLEVSDVICGWTPVRNPHHPPTVNEVV